jgi:hypothetical protein
MTIKEIAQAVGKDERTIQRWIEKVLHTQNVDVDRQNVDVDRQNVDVESIRLKAGSRDPHHPADYTLNETLIIIEAGIGPEAAGVFRANAQQKAPGTLASAPVLRELRLALKAGAISAAQYRKAAGIPEAEAAETPESGDIVGQFLEERTVGTKGGKIQARELYRAFKVWSEAQGEQQAPSEAWFGRHLAGRIVKRHERTGKVYFNIELKTPYAEPVLAPSRRELAPIPNPALFTPMPNP